LNKSKFEFQTATRSVGVGFWCGRWQHCLGGRIDCSACAYVGVEGGWDFSRLYKESSSDVNRASRSAWRLMLALSAVTVSVRRASRGAPVPRSSTMAVRAFQSASSMTIALLGICWRGFLLKCFVRAVLRRFCRSVNVFVDDCVWAAVSTSFLVEIG
jgi:hypothetical protein